MLGQRLDRLEVHELGLDIVVLRAPRELLDVRAESLSDVGRVHVEVGGVVDITYLTEVFHTYLKRYSNVLGYIFLCEGTAKGNPPHTNLSLQYNYPHGTGGCTS